MEVILTAHQVWFVKCAIEAKDAVLPLHPNSLDDDVFKKDYGVSKDVINAEIVSLKNQINFLLK